MITITKNVAFLLRGTKCGILIKHVNLEIALLSLEFVLPTLRKENKLTKTARVSVLRRKGSRSQHRYVRKN